MKKLISLLMMTLLVTSGYASDNSIYIDQSGDNSTITMLQDGAGNRVRGIQGQGTGNTTPSMIKGDAISVDIQQIGSGSVLNMGIDTTTANGASPTTVKYKVTGNNAVATINLNQGGDGISASQNLNIDQTGDGAITTVSMLGSVNSLTAIQTGGNNNKLIATINAANVIGTVNQVGGGANETTLHLTGDKGTIDITTDGALNKTNITQSGGSTSGHYAKVDLYGSSNTTIINQSGTIDTAINLKSAGSGNTFTLTSRN